jgi:colicin import membrane protein
MSAPNDKKYLIVSAVLHAGILLIFLLGFDYSSPLAVIENTNKHDIISAVVLGDTADSKLLPQKAAAKPKPPEPLPPVPQKNTAAKSQPDKDVIALQAAEKKKLADKKLLEEKKHQDQLAKDLLADLEATKNKQKKLKQKPKAVTSSFEKTLREQAEKSLRQQLLNEEIKLQGTQTREAQGVIDKYKALILQSISEHWLVPPGANKKLYCELMIRVAPGGMVIDVQVSKSSGDPALDSSARAAVLKSSPLPVPKESAAFEPFRRFVLRVKPENVIGNEGGLG